MAVWLDATYCIAQLVQALAITTLPTATMNRCRHSVGVELESAAQRERHEARAGCRRR